MNPKTERLSKLVKELRADLALSQGQFAKRLGVSRPAVSLWEAKVGLPDTNNLQKLAALKGWSVEDLQLFIEEGKLPVEDPVEKLLAHVRSLPVEAVARIVREGAQILALAHGHGERLNSGS